MKVRRVLVVVAAALAAAVVSAAPATAAPSDSGSCNGGNVSQTAKAFGGIGNAFKDFGPGTKAIGPEQQELHQDICR